MATDWQAIKRAEDILRQRRIKVDVDYALMAKYGEIHVICYEVFADQINEVFGLAGVVIRSIHPIPSNGGDMNKL